MIRFDIETDIMSAWNVIEDIKFISELILEDDDFIDMPPKQKDKLTNILIGMEHLYNYRFNKLFDDYTKLLAELHELKE